MTSAASPIKALICNDDPHDTLCGAMSIISVKCHGWTLSGGLEWNNQVTANVNVKIIFQTACYKKLFCIWGPK